MILDGSKGTHLTYCSNIHPGETLDEIEQVVRDRIPAVKQRVAPDRPFGIGLRLADRASGELARPGRLERFGELLARENLYVFTINGFPYGAFHKTRVKERVYLPDWTDERRLDYTNRLARQLAFLLPENDDLTGTISTVPGGYAGLGRSEQDAERMGQMMLRHAAILLDIRQRTGRIITLEIEPEPMCLISTTDQAIDFFQKHLRSNKALARFGRLTGLEKAQAERFLQRHLGICYDACHFAVEFEDPAASVNALERAGIRIGKVQISAGLDVPRVTPEMIEKLEAFAEGIYLHQVTQRSGGAISRFSDLPEAMDAFSKSVEPPHWRVHFHVPIFADRLGEFESTKPFLESLLPILAKQGKTRHYEVETYTWDVLPERFRNLPLDESIARELNWVKKRLQP